MSQADTTAFALEAEDIRGSVEIGAPTRLTGQDLGAGPGVSSKARPIHRLCCAQRLRRARPEAPRRNAIRTGKWNARLAVNAARRHRRMAGSGATPTPRTLATSRLRIADRTRRTQDDGATIGKRLALYFRRLRLVDAPPAGSQQSSEQYAESNLQVLGRAMGIIIFPHEVLLFFRYEYGCNERTCSDKC
jgi:hypothetical protein